MENQLFYKIALSLIPGIGGVLARNLIAYVGDIEAIFKEKLNSLKKIPGIGEVNARRIRNPDVIEKAKAELEYVRGNKIDVLFYTDKNYPRRLLPCPDAPVLIYTKGEMNLDFERVVSVVGTRNATVNGKELCDNLIREMAERNYRILIISGLAYGIDIQAHKSAITYNLPTVAVLGHGMDLLYPSLHAATAEKMQGNGGLVTDFPSGSKIDPPNFIRRNRIIAGLADATIVVESGIKGGALITADIAASYNRDVFACPGRAGEPWSAGCNKLIKNNGAAMIESVDDLEYMMRWEETDERNVAVQQQLFVDLTDEESALCGLLKNRGPLFIDQISSDSGLPMSKVSSCLLNLEFKGVVKALPGKMYKLK